MPYIDREKVDEKTKAKLEALIEKSYSSYWRKKRLFDVFFATLILLFFLPLMVVIAIVICIDDPSAGPFFKQKRVGRHGKEFYMYKFRTMRPDAEQLLDALKDKNEMEGPVFKIKEDPRITRVGKVLRKLSLDELMQFFNVFKGDMSLVGPRPPLPREVEYYTDYQKLRLHVTPGITCTWQIHKNRNDVPFEEWVEMDLDYIQNRTFPGDILIMLKTPLVMLSGTGTVRISEQEIVMKVAMIGHKVIPSRRGGIEKVLTSLCPLLVENGVEVTCYNRSSDEVENEYVGTVKEGKYEGVTLRRAFTVPAKGLSAMIASFTAAISATFRGFDVLHFHAEGPCAAMWIPKMFGKKCVATVHGLDWQREKWGKGFASKYIKFGEKVMVKCADEIIVLSQSAADYFETTYGRKTVLIHNGIEKPVRKAAEKITEQFGLTEGSYLCVVSRLTAEKGIHYLMDAFNQIKTDKKLVIAGDTSDTDEYVALLKEKAKGNPNILFTGFISGDTLAELYSNAYLVALPSDLEGMSLSLLEALSYGNAVLCSDIPENTLVTEDKAVHFKKSNVEDLKEKLQMLCDDPATVLQMKQGVSEWILAKYNWNDIAALTAELYQKVRKK